MLNTATFVICILLSALCQLNAQTLKISLKEESDLLFLNKTKLVDGKIVTAEKWEASQYGMRLVSLQYDQTTHRYIKNTLIDSLKTILDFVQDTATKKFAVMAEKDSSAPGRRSVFMVRATDDRQYNFTHCYYSYFDSSGHVGYKNYQSQSIYRHFNGTGIVVSNNTEQSAFSVKSLGPANKRNLAIINTSKGYFIYSLQSGQPVSNAYADTIWEFTPRIYVAARNKIFRLIELNEANVIVDSSRTFVIAKKLAGHMPVLELMADDSSRTLIPAGGPRILISNNQHKRVEAIHNYQFEDSLMIRFSVDTLPKLAFYELARLSSGTLHNLKEVAAHIELFPLFRQVYRSRVNSNQNFIMLDKGHREQLRDDGVFQLFRIRDSITRNAMLFVCHNSHGFTVTYLLKVPPNPEDFELFRIDGSSFTGDRFAFFENNILRVKDKSGTNVKTGWKLIDGNIYQLPAHEIDAAGDFIYTSPYYRHRTARFNHIYHTVTWPFASTEYSSALHLLVEINGNPGQYRALRIEYAFPPARTKPFSKTQIKTRNAR